MNKLSKNKNFLGNKYETSLDYLLNIKTGFKNNQSVNFLRNPFCLRNFDDFNKNYSKIPDINILKKTAENLLNSNDFNIFKEICYFPEETLILFEENSLDNYSFWKFKKIIERKNLESDIYLGLGLKVEENIPNWEVFIPDLNQFNPIFDFSKNNPIKNYEIPFIDEYDNRYIKMKNLVVPLITLIKECL